MADDREKHEARYPMRVVTRLTGLGPDVIRKWQERYGAVEPARTEGNTRRFSAADVRRLGLLRDVTARGHAIGEVARLSEEALEGLLGEGTGAAPAAGEGESDVRVYERLGREYLEAVERFDVRRAGEILSRTSLMVPVTELTYRFVVPVLREVGERWQHGRMSVAHEHLVSAQMRGLLTVALHWAAPQPGAHRVVVTTPEGHLHEFGALAGALLSVGRGFEPVYLGPSVPEGDIMGAVEGSGASLLMLSVVREVSGGERVGLAAQLRRLSSRVETWVGLPEGHGLVGATTGARWFHRYEDLDAALTRAGLQAQR